MRLSINWFLGTTLFCGLLSATAFAQEPLPVEEQEAVLVDEIVVVADPLQLLELSDSETAYGLGLSYAQTPRSISVISDALIERFDIKTVDDLAAITPGSFTGSFFGVPGSVSLRGNRADTYWRGFKRVENPGTFPTPLGASERIEILRGPTPAVYGAGRVGGFLNIIPRTTRTMNQIGDQGTLVEIGATIGSYGRKEVSGDIGHDFDLSEYDAGFFLHTEYEDSNSFYRGISPERTYIQAASTFSKPDIFDIEIGGAFFSSNGYKQTAGWNRITQDLIDKGTYITGRDTDLSDLNGDGKLTPDEVDAAVGAFFGSSNIRQFIDFGVFPSPAFALDDGVGTTQLDPRTVFISDRDFADAATGTFYADFSYHLTENARLKFQAFYDTMRSDLYVSYGFAAEYDSDVFEARASINGPISFFGISADNNLGISYRRYQNKTRQTFLSGYLALDRRDLSIGPTANDIFDDPFSVEANGIDWDTDLDSTTTDIGLFGVSNIALTERLNLLASLRVDRFSASSINTGATIFDPTLGFTRFKNTKWSPSYEVSARYDFAVGLSPYVTFARNNALETNDGGGIEVDRIAQQNFVADSDLIEAGIKLATSSVSGSIALYKQNRKRTDPFGNLDEEKSKGIEAELKYLINDHFSFTGSFTHQDTRISAPGACGSGNGEFVVLPPSRLVIAPEDGYGGLFAALNASCLNELQNGYERNTAPDWIASGFLTYTAPRIQDIAIGATLGGVYVSETGGKIENAIVLPDYFLTQASAYLDFDHIRIVAHVSNLLNQRYFIPVQNVYEEVGALPGPGRQFSISLKARF